MTESVLPAPISGIWAEPGQTIDSYGPFSGVSASFLTAGNPAASAWPTALLAIFVPVQVRRAATAYKLWYAGGATATGTIDIAVYDSAANRKVSLGNTAKGGALENFVNTTDTALAPGLYYIGLVCSNNTDTFIFSANANTGPIPTALGCLTQALGSAVLPDPAVWAIDQTLTKIPAMGISIGTVL